MMLGEPYTYAGEPGTVGQDSGSCSLRIPVPGLALESVELGPYALPGGSLWSAGLGSSHLGLPQHRRAVLVRGPRAQHPLEHADVGGLLRERLEPRLPVPCLAARAI